MNLRYELENMMGTLINRFESMINIPSIPISSILQPKEINSSVELYLLRTDLIHPQISGNKWFKLKYHLEEAGKLGIKKLLSFGGAYSNHLHALAYAGKELGLETIGIVRGDEVENNTLLDCRNWGMTLHFISRDEYKNKTEPDFIQSLKQKFQDSYFIPEGGNSELGRKGAAQILNGIDLTHYNYIACAVGTGCTFSGLIQSSLPTQKLEGFVALKGAGYLQNEIKEVSKDKNWECIHDYHFGGFAKQNENLFSFMHSFYTLNKIELDFVYTAKMMFGLFDRIRQHTYPDGTRILAVHTGGIQGNRSVQNLQFLSEIKNYLRPR